MTFRDGRAEMLALDLPYIRRLMEAAKQHRTTIYAVAAMAALDDGVLTDDEEAALLALALVIVTLRREVQAFGNETTLLAAEVGTLAGSRGFDYAQREAQRVFGITLRYQPIHQPIGRYATAARIGGWPAEGEWLFRKVFGEQWQQGVGRGVAPGQRARMALDEALSAVFGDTRNPLRGVMTRRGIMTVHQSNMDTFRETAVEAWNVRELQAVKAEWRWRARLDDRTCVACIRKHGRRFAIDIPFRHSHAGCRCMPEVIRSDTPGVQTGDQWMRKQPLDTVQAMMGQEAGLLFHSGELELDDFVKGKRDKDFGVTYRQGSLDYAKRKAARRKERQRNG